MKKMLILLWFGILLCLPIILAANTVTLVTPAQDASISGSTYKLNATLDTNTLNLTRATFYYDTGSANVTIANNVSNFSATSFNVTWDTTGIVDVNNYVIWVNVTNETGVPQTTDSSTGVDIDNGNPTATWSSSSIVNNQQTLGSDSLTFGLAADSTIGISSCSIICTDATNSSVSSTGTTVSANACTNSTTLASFPLPSKRAYNCVVQATDGNGDKTNSTSRLLTYIVAESGGSAPSSRAGTLNSIVSGGASASSSFFTGVADFFKLVWDTITFWN